MITFNAINSNEENDDYDDIDNDDIEFEDTEEDTTKTPSKKRIATPSRYYRAKSTASVATIKQRIENIFGLPEGSIRICKPDGTAFRADAAIKTVRKNWGE
jgi:hypothetical protein